MRDNRNSLRLRKEHIRTLSASDLRGVMGGCDTTSVTTEVADRTQSGVNCPANASADPNCTRSATALVAVLVALIGVHASGCGGLSDSTGEQEANSGPVGAPAGVGEANCDYPQTFGTPTHTGKICQSLHGMQVIATLRQDPTAKVTNDFDGFLQIHQGAPLTSGNFLAFATHVAGNLENPDDRSLDVTGVDLWRWSPSVTAPNAELLHVATIASSWQSVDGSVASFGYVTNGYMQQAPVAFANGALLVPQSSARFARVNPATGATLSTIDPFAGSPFDGDARLTTAGGLTVAQDGTVYYTAVAWPLGSPTLGTDFRGAWLIRVAPSGATTLVPWTQVASATVGIPQRDDSCVWPFGTGGTPGPTGPDSQPPLFKCGLQRPEMNAAIAIRPTDGHLIAYSSAHNNIWTAYLIDLDPVTLAPVRAYPTRNHVLQGCGVRVPLLGSVDFGDTCDVITAHGTTHLGFAADFNQPQSFRGNGIMDNHPFCTPAGDCGVGGYVFGFFGDGEEDARGATVMFHSDGTDAPRNEDYAWEVTPSLDAQGRYHQDRVVLSALDSQAAIYDAAWELVTKSAIPIDFTAFAVDMLDTQIPVDVDGHSYALDANGHLYQMDGAGVVVDFVTLIDPDTGETLSMDGLSSYLHRDRAGHVIFDYAGWIWVVGSGGAQSETPVSREVLTQLRTPSAKMRASMAAKRHALTTQDIPEPPTSTEPPRQLSGPQSHIAPNTISNCGVNDDPATCGDSGGSYHFPGVNPGGSSVGLEGVDDGNTFDGPVKFGRNWRAEISRGVFQQFYDQECTLD
jgi:hypothetical protein